MFGFLPGLTVLSHLVPASPPATVCNIVPHGPSSPVTLKFMSSSCSLDTHLSALYKRLFLFEMLPYPFIPEKLFLPLLIYIELYHYVYISLLLNSSTSYNLMMPYLYSSLCLYIPYPYFSLYSTTSILRNITSRGKLQFLNTHIDFTDCACRCCFSIQNGKVRLHWRLRRWKYYKEQKIRL